MMSGLLPLAILAIHGLWSVRGLRRRPGGLGKPLPNWHVAMMSPPWHFDAFKTRERAYGVLEVLGLVRGYWTIHAFKFNADIFSEERARAWTVSPPWKFIPAGR